MNTRTLKSLNEAVAKVASPVSKSDVAKGFVNSLTGKARQIHEAEEKKENEKSESPFHEKKERSGHEMDELVKRLAAKALKRAKKKSRRSSESDYAGAKPKAASYDPDMKNTGAVAEEIELAEMAAPGYEDWASDPKVKRSFKKQYGKRWKQVMYGHSWNMKKMDEETEQLDEISDTLLFRARAKAKGVGKFKVRTNPSFAGSSKDIPLHKKITKELQRRGSVPVSESEQLDEEWGGGFQSFKDAHREVQAGLRREASANRRKLVADIKAVHSGKMTKHAFTRKHKMRIDDLPLAKKMAASRAKAKAKYLAKKAAKASAPKADSTPSIMEGMQLDEISDKLKARAASRASAMLHHSVISSHGTGPDREEAGRTAAKRLRQLRKFTGNKNIGMPHPRPVIVNEAGYKRLGRIKAAAYKAELASRMDPKTPAEDNKVMNAVVKHIKAKRAAAEREAQVAAGMARRGGASPDAVRGGGSRIGPSGKYTKKAGKLANQRDKALASFRTKGRIAQLLDKREDQSRKKRERQQAQAKFNMDARHGYFGHEIAPEIAKAGMRARYNYEKKYGRLKGK